MICRLGFGLIDLQPLAFSKCTFFNVIRVPYLSYLAHQREMTFEDGVFLRDEKIPFTTQFAISLFGLKSNMWNKYIIFFGVHNLRSFEIQFNNL